MSAKINDVNEVSMYYLYLKKRNLSKKVNYLMQTIFYKNIILF